MEISPSDLIWNIIWGAEFGWAWRIHDLGLRRRFPFLFGYLVFSGLHSIASTVIIGFWRWRSETYLWFWTWTYPVWWALMLCVVLEAWSRMTRRRGTFILPFGVLGFCAIQVLFGHGTPHNQEKIIYTTLAALTWMLMSTAEPLGIRVERDVAVVFVVFELWFLAEVGTLFFPAGIEPQVQYTILPIVLVLLMLVGAWTFERTAPEAV